MSNENWLIEITFIFRLHQLHIIVNAPWRLLIFVAGDSARYKNKSILSYTIIQDLGLTSHLIDLS